MLEGSRHDPPSSMTIEIPSSQVVPTDDELCAEDITDVGLDLRKQTTATTTGTRGAAVSSDQYDVGMDLDVDVEVDVDVELDLDQDLECLSIVGNEEEPERVVPIVENKDDDDIFQVMERVSSCFFSVDSGMGGGVRIDSMRSLEGSSNSFHSNNSNTNENDNENETTRLAKVAVSIGPPSSLVEILCHDMVMNVLSYLDSSSLVAFSETARRPNFECHYFLRLRLEHALQLPLDKLSTAVDDDADTGVDVDAEEVDGELNCPACRRVRFEEEKAEYDREDDGEHEGLLRTIRRRRPPNHDFAVDCDSLGMEGAASVVIRLAALSSPETAQTMVLEGYLRRCRAQNHLHGGGVWGDESRGGETRLAYLRRIMMDYHHHHHRQYSNSTSTTTAMTMLPPQLLCLLRPPSQQNPKNLAAAAALLMTLLGGAYAVAGGGVTVSSEMAAGPALFGVFGALVKKFKDDQDPTPTTSSSSSSSSSNESKEEQTPSSEAPDASNTITKTGKSYLHRHPSFLDEIYAMEHPCNPNPYNHDTSHPTTTTTSWYDRGSHSTATTATTPTTAMKKANAETTKFPPDGGSRQASGCVGAYHAVLREAALSVRTLVKSDRMNRKHTNESGDVSMAHGTLFMDACANDDVAEVRRCVESLGVDVDAHHVAVDGTTGLGLHAAAFAGSLSVLRYLCRPVCPLCLGGGAAANVNVVDDHGWTALHHAAGADRADVIRILLVHRADAIVEAHNGYTPYHWAERLGHTVAMEELQRWGADDRRFFNGADAHHSYNAIVGNLADRFFPHR